MSPNESAPSKPVLANGDRSRAPAQPPALTLPDDFTTTDAADLAHSLKALADPIRLRLISLIGSHPNGKVSVLELAQGFHVTGPTLSHHLRVLREAGLVSPERRGTWIYYALVPDSLAAISGILGSTFTDTGQESTELPAGASA